MTETGIGKVKKFISLRRKLMVAILFASSIITLLTTAFQYYIEYQRDLDYLNQTIQRVGTSNSSSLSRSLWNLDDQQIQVQLDSILKLRDIVGVAIYDESGKVYYENMDPLYLSDDKFSSEFPLFLNEDMYKHDLGKFLIWGTKIHIDESLISKMINFFLAQSVKTLIIILVMLYLFRIFITKHLNNVVKFMKQVDLNSKRIERLPSVKRRNESIDEIDYVNDSINYILERVERANIETGQKIERQEKEIQLQKAASINSARLASLGEMAANIAHEINNPLTVLSFSGKKILHLLKDEDINRERLRHFANMINRTVERMTKTITSLKRLSRDTAEEPFDTVVLYDMIERLLDLCQMSLHEKGIDITTEFIGFDFSTKIQCQEVKVTQVVINLLNNARDEIQGLDNPWIKLIVSKDADYITFSVVDCGKGIPIEVQERMFEPFFTTKEIGQGTGLGLSISASTAKEHNGRLFIDNSKENTTITLEFPVNL